MKYNRLFRNLILVTILPFIMLLSCTTDQDWPQFRGPREDMSFKSSDMVTEWGKDKNISWVAELDGTGYSSPIIIDGNIYITSAYPEKVNPVPERPMGPPPQGGQGQQGGSAPQQARNMPAPSPAPPMPEVRDTSFLKEIYKLELICFDLRSGEEKWRQIAYQGAPKAAKNPNSTYACETPASDGKRIVAYFGMNGLFCYDLEGNLLWNKDLGVYYTQKGWGTGSSPVIYNDIVFIQFDNEDNSSLFALDIVTGNEKWRVSRDEKTTYSTPYIWKNKSRTELVTCGKTARSYDPETGDLLWKIPVGGEQVIPSPVGNDELLILGNAGGREIKSLLLAVRAGTEGEVVWKKEDSGLGNPSPLLYNGLVYLIGSRGEIAVLDAENGNLKYQKRITGIGSCWASPWACNQVIYFLDEKGTTRAFKAGDTFEQTGENTLEGRKFWASVAVSGDKYIFRAGDKLYCVK